MSRYRIMMALAGAAAAGCAALLAVTHAAQTRAAATAWGQAIEVPGLGALNAGGHALVSSVSCASAGSCTAGGGYTDHHGRFQAFVASQRNGRWGTAIEVPGTAALNAGGEAQVNSVSCNQPGPCTAGGSYKHSHGPTQGFVVNWS